jgi:hypothetical protein
MFYQPQKTTNEIRDCLYLFVFDLVERLGLYHGWIGVRGGTGKPCQKLDTPLPP